MVGIARKDWTQTDWLAYLDGWCFERLGYPKPPPEAHGPEKREGAARIIEAMPPQYREGAAKDAVAKLSPADRRGLFFDIGRVDAKEAA